jgi:conjugative transfer signal peptidase TraF
MRLRKSGHANRRYLAFALAPTGLFLIGAVVAMWTFGVRINMTRSLPLGLYLITDNPKANLVAFCPSPGIMDESAKRGYRGHSYGLGCPDGAPPLMKPVVATPGQRVLLDARGISVGTRLLPNTAPLPFDAKHRELRAWPAGCYTVEPGTLWVASSVHPGSYDSRYLGPIRTDQILYRLRPLWLFE